MLTCHPKVPRRVLVAVASLALYACSSTATPPAMPRTEQTEQQRVAAKILDIALGKETSAQTQSPNAALFNIPKDKLVPKPEPKPKPNQQSADLKLDFGAALTDCLELSSALPGPANDDRVFLLGAGKLSVLRDNKRPEILTFQDGTTPDFAISYLLGFHERNEGLELLITTQPTNNNKPELRILLVIQDDKHDDKFAGPPYDAPLDVDQILNDFTLPRCKTKNTECIERHQQDNGTCLLLGETTSVCLPLDDIKSAVWSPKNDGSIYVLKRCEPSGQAPRSP